jgi:succinate dehydrogenase flavin-adding protein (antitoxin of CptAB toxin-antitoxin module)
MDYNQEQKQDRKTLLWAALAVLALLNIVLLYFFYQERQENESKDTIIAAKTEEVLFTKTKLDSISAQLDAKIAEIQQLGGSVDSLIVLKQQLERDKQSLTNLNTYSARKYEDKIKSYEAILTQKDRDIAQLREELGIVTAKNEELSQTLTGLQTERQALADSVTNYAVQNRELSEKVTMASALRAENISVNALNSRGKEREGGSYKARRIDKLKVSFAIAPNAVARQDRKEIFMRILDPNGAVLSDMATGSGAFVHNGREMIYSSKEAVNFNNSRQTVDIMYGRGGVPLKDGKYTVELYSEGFKIGQGDFTVK